MEIREIDPGHYDELGRLTVDVYLGVAGFEPGEAYLGELGDVARRAEQAVVLVAVDAGGRVLGGVTYVPGPGPYYEWDGAADAAGIRMLAVAPDARGAGVGTALVRACLARARSEGRRRVWLHTTPEMTEAQRIYEREGFVREPEPDWTHGICLWIYVLDLGTAPGP